MIERTGDMMVMANQPNQVILATTNNVVKANGELVMGGGAALAVARMWPEAPKEFGVITQNLNPNHYCYWGVGDPYGAFQTKHHYYDPSSLKLIELSARKLQEIAEAYPEFTFHLPFPGIGLGSLKEFEVRPVLERIISAPNIMVWKLK